MTALWISREFAAKLFKKTLKTPPTSACAVCGNIFVQRLSPKRVRQIENRFRDRGTIPSHSQIAFKTRIPVVQVTGTIVGVVTHSSNSATVFCTRLIYHSTRKFYARKEFDQLRIRRPAVLTVKGELGVMYNLQLHFCNAYWSNTRHHSSDSSQPYETKLLSTARMEWTSSEHRYAV